MQIAILCFGDLVEVARSSALPFVDIGGITKPADNALMQLLLKSVSKDKKFVLEAAQKVLRTCARCLDPCEMLHRAMPYAKHKCATLSCTPFWTLCLDDHNFVERSALILIDWLLLSRLIDIVLCTSFTQCLKLQQFMRALRQHDNVLNIHRSMHYSMA